MGLPVRSAEPPWPKAMSVVVRTSQKEKCRRLGWIVGAWIVAGLPATIVVVYWFGWWAVIPVAAFVWVTRDYYRRGEMVAAIESTQQEGVFWPKFLGGDEPGR